MLFISPHGNFCLTGIVQARDHYHPVSGLYLNTTPGIDAQFQTGLAPEWAVDIALQTWAFRGLAEGEDPRLNVGCFDTDLEAGANGWDEETKKHVEDYLVAHQDQYYMVCESPPVEKPWPAYEKTHHNSIVSTAKEIGVPVEQVLAYERQNKNRPSVVEQILAWQAEEAPQPEYVAA